MPLAVWGALFVLKIKDHAHCFALCAKAYLVHTLFQCTSTDGCIKVVRPNCLRSKKAPFDIFCDNTAIFSYFMQIIRQ